MQDIHAPQMYDTAPLASSLHNSGRHNAARHEQHGGPAVIEMMSKILGHCGA